jgi:hypothetical protein
LINDFFTQHDDLEQLKNLITYSFITIGSFLNAIYLTFGMISLPFFLIKGTKSLEDESEELQGSL